MTSGEEGLELSDVLRELKAEGVSADEPLRWYQDFECFDLPSETVDAFTEDMAPLGFERLAFWGTDGESYLETRRIGALSFETLDRLHEKLRELAARYAAQVFMNCLVTAEEDDSEYA